jgi:integrase
MARRDGKDRGITYKDGSWWVRLYVNEREKWHKADNKSQAKALYGRLKAEIREGTYFPEKLAKSNEITLRAWICRCLEGSVNRGIENERRYGRRWSLYLRKRLLTEVTTEDLRRIQAKLRVKLKPQKKGQALRRQWSDATINRHFSFLRHVLMLAVKDGKLPRNAVSGLKFLPEAKRTRFFSETELMALRNAMAPVDWALVAFAVEAGLRRGEQFNLRWDQVDLENGLLTLPLPKGGRTRHVPLSDGAKAILRSLDSFLRSAWVFPGLRDQSTAMDSRAFLRRAFEPALRKAGIVGACWHTLRHTAASRRVMAGVDLVAVKEILGHRDIQTTMRYSHLSPGHLSEAVNRGSLIGTGSKTGSAGEGSLPETPEVFEKMVRPARLELATPRSVV